MHIFIRPRSKACCSSSSCVGPACQGVACEGMQQPPRKQRKFHAQLQKKAEEEKKRSEDARRAREGNARKGTQVQPSAQFQATMEMLMLGHISCITANAMAVGQAADAAAMGCPMHPEMKMLAEIGTKGRCKQNLWRDLEIKLRLRECNFPEPLLVAVPVLDSTLAYLSGKILRLHVYM